MDIKSENTNFIKIYGVKITKMWFTAIERVNLYLQFVFFLLSFV